MPTHEQLVDLADALNSIRKTLDRRDYNGDLSPFTLEAALSDLVIAVAYFAGLKMRAGRICPPPVSDSEG